LLFSKWINFLVFILIQMCQSLISCVKTRSVN
jgi:hypothetical protein